HARNLRIAFPTVFSTVLKVRRRIMRTTEPEKCERWVSDSTNRVGGPNMFVKKGDEPGVISTGARRIRKKGDGGTSTANRPLPQINPPPTQATAIPAARAILTAARRRGIHVGAAPDGSELILVASLKVPGNVRRWFEHWIDQFQIEIIAIILNEKAAQEGEF